MSKEIGIPPRTGTGGNELQGRGVLAQGWKRKMKHKCKRRGNLDTVLQNQRGRK